MERVTKNSFRKMNIGNTRILGVAIDFYCIVDREAYDLGGVTLKKDDREYMLDVCKSSIDPDCHKNHFTRILCELEEDKDVFPDCKYDLKGEDLSNLDEATLFVGGDEIEIEPESISFFYESNNCVQVIELNQE